MSYGPSTISKEICRVFEKGGTCKFGGRCHFLHSEVKSDDNGAVSKTKDLSRVGAERQLCKAYLQTRFCRFGARCRYLHTQPPLTSTVSESQTKDEGLSVASQGTTLAEPAAAETGSPYFSFNLPQSQAGRGQSYGNRRGQRGRYRPAGRRGGGYNSGSRNVNQPAEDATEQTRNNVAPNDVLEPSLEVRPASEGQTPVPSHPPQPVTGGDRQQGPKAHPANRRRLCRYFKAGQCNQGNNCYYWHPAVNFDNLQSSQNAARSGGKPARRPRPKPVRKPTTVPLDELTDEHATKLRETEIKQLIRRFSKAEKVSNTEEKHTSYRLIVSPSDPDWGYDVKNISLIVKFPDAYPRKAMSISVDKEQELPETVIRYTSRTIKDWIKEKFEQITKQDKVELMFGPFLRWFDRSMEDIFTEALKQYKRELMAEAAGVQFISAEQLQKEYYGSASGDSEEEEDDEEEESDSDNSSEEEDEDDDDDDLPPEQPGHVGELPPGGYSEIDPQRKGTEVKLQKLQLTENATTLLPTQIRVQTQCSRCKNRQDVMTPCGKLVHMECEKCSQEMAFTFRAAMAHQMSSVIGYMDLHNCTAFDLLFVDCWFNVGCFNCNKEMRIEGLQAGQPKDIYCFNCNKKMQVSTESARFQQLQQEQVLDLTKARLLKKKKKDPKDPAIQEGQPLPKEGACKHYKKSFRWLRFPCCGKAYPCDRCHDEKEKDHDMVFATRMICGFCCKEQRYSPDKACVSCGSSLTKTHSVHWEGGKGCRDKVKMSRNDDKKYASMSKTISRKSSENTKPKSKTLKLRHT